MPVKKKKVDFWGIDFWDRYAKDFVASQEFVIGKPTLETIYNTLDREIKSGEVADLGCGTGLFTKIIAKNVKNIIAVDISDGMIDAANIYLNDYHNITFQKDNIENSSLPSNKFDNVLLCNIVHIMEFPLKNKESDFRNHLSPMPIPHHLMMLCVLFLSFSHTIVL